MTTAPEAHPVRFLVTLAFLGAWVLCTTLFAAALTLVPGAGAGADRPGAAVPILTALYSGIGVAAYLSHVFVLRLFRERWTPGTVRFATCAQCGVLAFVIYVALDSLAGSMMAGVLSAIVGFVLIPAAATVATMRWQSSRIANRAAK